MARTPKYPPGGWTPITVTMSLTLVVAGHLANSATLRADAASRWSAREIILGGAETAGVGPQPVDQLSALPPADTRRIRGLPASRDPSSAAKRVTDRGSSRVDLLIRLGSRCHAGPRATGGA